MSENDFELVVSPGKLRLWRIIGAGLLFTVIIFLISDVLIYWYNVGLNEKTLNDCVGYIYEITLCIALAFKLATMKTVLIDVDTNLIISRYSIGSFSVDRKSACPKLEYVSVFDNVATFDVNLWYVGNRHYKMYEFLEVKPALEFARLVAIKLDLELLDATIPKNKKWLDKNLPIVE